MDRHEAELWPGLDLNHKEQLLQSGQAADTVDETLHFTTKNLLGSFSHASYRKKKAYIIFFSFLFLPS